MIAAATALLDRAVRAAAARHIDIIGRRATFNGLPYVENSGHIEIGDDFVLVSRPVQSHIIVGPHGKLRIGHDVYFDQGAAMSVFSRVTIGDGVRLGRQVIVMDSNFHEIRDRGAPGRAHAIVIGANVSIGARVTILQGITIGEGTTVVDGSVVARSLPPHVRAAGIPARPIAG